MSNAEPSHDIEGYGDHSLWIIVNDIRETFEKDTGISLHLIREFAIRGKGCDKGMLHASMGRPDRNFGLICCGIDERTIREYGLEVYAVMREPLTIIANSENPVGGLSLAEVRKIFSGRISRWSETGGKDEGIVVVTRLHCGRYKPNWHRILNSAYKFTGKKVDVSSEPDMARTVGDFHQAIGHLEMTSVLEYPGRIKILAVDGYMPTSDNLAKGKYPLWTDLSVVTSGEAKGKVLEFIKYLRNSPKIRRAIRKYGAVQNR